MAGCNICDDEADLQYRCNYCGSVFCSTHRLPENHDCPALIVFEEIDTSWFKDDRDISELRADDVDVSDAVIDAIDRAPDMNARSEATRTRKTRAVIDVLSDVAEIDDDELLIGAAGDSTPYETVEPGTVGTRIDPDYDRSPDMNPDGSLKQPETTATGDGDPEDDTSDAIPPLSRLFFLLLVIALAATLYIFLV